MNIAASRTIFAILSQSIESGGSRRVFTKSTSRSSGLCPVVMGTTQNRRAGPGCVWERGGNGRCAAVSLELTCRLIAKSYESIFCFDQARGCPPT